MIKEETKSVVLDNSINNVPKFKGRTKIELFENGEKVAEHIDENMQTNFINNVFNQPRINTIGENGYKLLSDNMPIYDKLLGGLLLYADAVQEDADNILVSVANECIGHAGSAYSGTNKRRGSYNANESGFIDADEKWLGYRHVWDFGTDKANGVISCACLTSKIGGNSGWGNGISYTSNENNAFVEAMQNGISGIVYNSSIYTTAYFRYIGNIEGVDKFAYIDNANHLVLLEAKINDMQIGLTDSIDANRLTWNINDANNGNPNIAIYTIQMPFAVSGNISMFVNDGNLYLVNQATSSTFSYAVFDATTREFGQVQSRSVSPEYANSNRNNLVLANGYWFARSASGNLVRYAEAGGQGEEFEAFEFVHSSAQQIGSDVVFFDTGDSNYNSHMWVVNCDNPENAMYKASKISGGEVEQIIGENLIVIDLGNSSGSMSFSLRSARLSGCMATINNLATPITKTSAQTMKITYEVTAEGVE